MWLTVQQTDSNVDRADLNFGSFGISERLSGSDRGSKAQSSNHVMGQRANMSFDPKPLKSFSLARSAISDGIGLKSRVQMNRTNSIVLEIQRLATDRSQDVSDLLRKSLLVATKLKLDDFKIWIESELHGWRGERVPEYREARAEIRLKNPFHGLIPFFVADAEIMDLLCNIEIRDPIESLLHLVRNHSAGDPSPVHPLTPKQVAFILQHQDGMGLEPVRVLSITKVASVVDAVRTTILEWSLQLEAEGISGDNLVFTEEEKSRAVSSTNISIGNFQGILGNVEGSSVSQKLDPSIGQGNFASLRNYLSDNGVGAADLDDLEVAIQSDPQPEKVEALGPHVGEWIGRMTSKAAQGSWQVGVNAAAGLLAAAIGAYYGL